MLIVTTENVLGYEIEEYLGYISETVTLGVNDFAEFFQIFDVFGGESSQYKDKFQQAKEILNKRLEEKTQEIGGNAIIGLRINYQEITGKGKSSLLISGTGTAVKFKMTEEYKKRKEKEIKDKQSYIIQLPLKELINLLENTSIEKKEELKNIILSREDIQEIRKEYKDIPTSMLNIFKNEYINNEDTLKLIRIKIEILLRN